MCTSMLIISLINLFIVEMQSILKFYDQTGQTNFLEPLLIHVNLYQQAKNQTISKICSGDMIDQKILQSDWLRTFWHVFQE